MAKVIIGLCDDHEIVLDELEKLVTQSVDLNSKELEIMRFDSGISLLNYEGPLDILFLDIEMPHMDGIEVGQHLMHQRPKCKVIMATSRSDRFKEAFKINAFRFVEKPFEQLEVKQALDDAMETMLGFKEMEVYHQRLPYVILQRDICYLQAYNGTVELVVGDMRMRKDVSLSQVEDELDNKLFFKIDKSYIVNMFKVDNYKNGLVYIGDEELKVSRSRKKDFEKTLVEFDLHYRG